MIFSKHFLYSVPIYFLKHTFLNYLIIINTSGFKLRYFNHTEKTIKNIYIKKKDILRNAPTSLIVFNTSLRNKKYMGFLHWKRYKSTPNDKVKRKYADVPSISERRKMQTHPILNLRRNLFLFV